jgi:uncharacterized protein (DUF58 family)
MRLNPNLITLSLKQSAFSNPKDSELARRVTTFLSTRHRPGLRHLRYQRHEVVVFHVMDAAELDFPFQDATLFRGLEQMPDLLTDPRSLRESYMEELTNHLDELRRGCRAQHVDYVPLRTDADVGVVLAGYLAKRLKK